MAPGRERAPRRAGPLAGWAAVGGMVAVFALLMWLLLAPHGPAAPGPEEPVLADMLPSGPASGPALDGDGYPLAAGHG